MGNAYIMTSKKVKLWALVATVLALVVALVSMPAKASAAEDAAGLAAGSAQVTTQEDIAMMDPEWVDLWAYEPEGYDVARFLTSGDESLEITKVTTSDSAVLKVETVDSEKNFWSYRVYPRKAGSATLAVTYSQNGASKTISAKYTVKTFPNAIKSLKFNGESMAVPTSQNPSGSHGCFGFKGTSGKVQVELAAGWSIGSFSGYFYDKNSNSLGNLEITNGKAFTIPAKASYGFVNLDIYSTNGDNFYYSLGIQRELPLKLIAKPVLYLGYPKITRLPFQSIYSFSSDIEVTSVKSSKPAVIAVKKNKDLYKVTLQPKKVGTSVITVKYKCDGKAFTAKTKCTVSKDYPIKSVAVNGKAVNLKKNPSGTFKENYKKNTGKVKITAAKGWKVKSLQYFSDISVQKGKKIKNGASVKTPKGKWAYVLATLKKGKATYTYTVNFKRA